MKRTVLGVCGVKIKAKNIGHHLANVHPIYSFDTKEIQLSTKCIFCGETADVNSTRYNLPICNEHYVSDVRKFLVRDFYLKLKAKNNDVLLKNPETASWMIHYIVNELFWLFSWEPENISEDQFLLFSETSNFAGYLLLRLSEILPQLGDLLTDISVGKLKEPTSAKQEKKINKLFLDLSVEFELFIGIKFAANGYFDIAADDEENPDMILIIPKTEKSAIDNILQLRLKDANAEWHGTFRKILVPYGTSSAVDESGAVYRFQRSAINANFDEFKEAWLEIFGTKTSMHSKDFESLWDWLKWVVSPDGFTGNNTSNAMWFDEYKKFNLTKKLVFEVFDQILAEPESEKHLISNKNIVKKDLDLTILDKLARISRAFKLVNSNEWIYFTSCREWFYNTIMPVFVEFTRSLDLAGKSFEEDVENICSFYSKTGTSTGKTSSFGFMVEPNNQDDEQKKLPNSSRNVKWKILGTNYKISIKEDEITKKIGSKGEVDIIVYANMNIYLIELKALNLDSKESLEYCETKAPIQCARYAHWVKKSNDFIDLLKKNGITQDDYKSVRILVCSSGGFNNLVVKCQETNELFSVVPEFVLFSGMAGLFTLSLKRLFPERIKTLSAGLKLSNLKRKPQILQLNLENNLGEKISSRLLMWTEVFKWDRRKNFSDFKFDPNASKSLNTFRVTHSMNEVFLGGTTDWVLRDPVKIGETKGYGYYLGTQLGNMGSSFVCEKCKSIIKYYFADNDEERKTLEKIFKERLCPICGNKFSESDRSKEILTNIGFFVTKFKKELQES